MNNTNSIAAKFCPKCQCETERHNDGKCKPCKRAYLYKWRKENPDKFRAIQEKWDVSNSGRLKKAAKALYLKNHKEKIAYAKEYYQNNKESLKPKKAQWQKDNLDLCRVYWNNRRTLKETGGGSLSSGLKTKLLSLQRGKCACCGLPLGDNYHLDHIMPLALGGSNTDDNIQLLTQRCNNQKHAKHPVDFMQSRGFLL